MVQTQIPGQTGQRPISYNYEYNNQYTDAPNQPNQPYDPYIGQQQPPARYSQPYISQMQENIAYDPPSTQQYNQPRQSYGPPIQEKERLNPHISYIPEEQLRPQSFKHESYQSEPPKYGALPPTVTEGLNRKRPKDWTPVLIRTPVLLFTCFIAIVLLALMGFVLKTLPPVSYDRFGKPLNINATGLFDRSFDKRQATTSSSGGGGTSNTNPNIFVTTSSSTVSIPSIVVPSTTDSKVFVTTAFSTVSSVFVNTDQSHSVGNTAPSVFVPTAASNTPATIFVTTNSAGVQVTSTRQVTGATNPNVFVGTATATKTGPVTGQPTLYTYISKISSVVVSGGVTKTIATEVAVATIINPDSPLYSSIVQADQGLTAQQIVLYGTYLPIVLATLFNFLWAAIYACFKLMDPFYQLARTRGATAQESLSINYLSSAMETDVLISFFRGHWVMLVSSLIYVALGFLAPLSSEALVVDTRWGCPGEPWSPSNPNPCKPRLSVNERSARAVLAILVFTALMILALIAFQWRRRSGVHSDPSTIATVASMMHHPEVLEDFRAVDPDASRHDLAAYLKNRKYRLGYYTTPTGQTKYGIIPLTDAMDRDVAREYVPISNTFIGGIKSKASTSWSHVLQSVLNCCYIILIIVMLGIVIYYYLESRATPLNNWLNSNVFGPRFLFTMAAGVIGAFWRTMEREIRTIQPWVALKKRPTLAHRSITQSQCSNPFSAFFYAIPRQNWFHALICVMALLAEPLVIVMGTVPFSPGQTYDMWRTSTFITIGILSVMTLVAASLLWWRKHAKFIRRPDVIAVVQSYVCDSFFLQDVEPLSTATDSEKKEVLKLARKRYTFGNKAGIDGSLRWLVDEVGIREQEHY